MVLLTALAGGDSPHYANLRAAEHWRFAEHALKQTGLLHSSTGPHHISVADDVLFSLRYQADEHIARERGEFVPQGGDPWPAFAMIDEPA